MIDFEAQEYDGVVARLGELIAVQPGPGGGSFAPRGRVRTHQYGGYRSVFRGQGMEFDEVRAYHAGDDIRTIDWRVTARTGRTHTKLFQEERERPVLLLVDGRSRMRFGTRGSFKSVLAARAAARLTWMSVADGDRVGGVLLSPSGIASFRPERSRQRILNFVKAIADGTQDGFGAPPPRSEPELADAIRRLRSAARPGTLVFVISDFHDLDGAAARELARLGISCQVACLLVYDVLEAAPPAHGLYPVSDGSEVALLDADRRAAREAYAARFADRQARIEALARRRGMAFALLPTGEDPAEVLHPERLRPKGGASRVAAA